MVLKSPQKSAGCCWFFTGAFLLRQKLHSGYGPFVYPRKLGLDLESYKGPHSFGCIKDCRSFLQKGTPCSNFQL